MLRDGRLLRPLSRIISEPICQPIVVPRSRARVRRQSTTPLAQHITPRCLWQGMPPTGLGWRCKQTPLLLQGRHTPHLVWRLVLWPRSGHSAWYRSWYRSWYRDCWHFLGQFPLRTFVGISWDSSRLHVCWHFLGQFPLTWRMGTVDPWSSGRWLGSSEQARRPEFP